MSFGNDGLAVSRVGGLELVQSIVPHIAMKLLSFIKFIGRPLFLILFSVEYHGVENVPASGPVIIAGNHPSYLDPALVGLPVKRVIKFMAWDALFKLPLLGWLIRALGAFPVDTRRGKGEAAYHEARRVLESGDALGIFPEGQRSERGPMGELRTGVARLAIETGAPIVPVTIGGASRAWPKKRLLPKPAKIIVRFHQPILVTDEQRKLPDNRQLHYQIMEEVAESINRSLAPALRGAAAWERWYRQPPSHIRIYEWVPVLAALVSTFISTMSPGRIGERWLAIWLPPALYYIYLISDLSVIPPSRLAKWIRNSMPIWLMMAWHYPLTGAIDVPSGELNTLLAVCVVAAFFPFFWEDYYTLQKFVRGLVVVYYVSLALLLFLPEPLGVFVALLSFIVLFNIWFRIVYYRITLPILLGAIAVSVYLERPGGVALVFVGLATLALVHIQTFVTVAYDVRKGGSIAASDIDQRVGQEP